MRRVLLAALLPASAAAQATTASASLPALRDDCQLSLTLATAGDTRACEPVALRASVTGRDGAPVPGFVTFASDGSANPGLPVALADGVAVANVSGLLPGVHQLTASFIRGRPSMGAPASPTTRCEEGTSPPIQHGVTRAIPSIAVTSVPSGGLKPTAPGGCDLGAAAFYVSVAAPGAAGTVDPAPSSASPACASPTGVVTLYLVRGSLTAEDVGEWDSPVSRAASATVAGLREGAANAASSAVSAALGGGGGGGGGGGASPSSPASALAAVATHLASPRRQEAAPASASRGGPASVVPNTLSALVQSARATAAAVGLGGGRRAAEGVPTDADAALAAAADAAAGPVATPAAAVVAATPAPPPPPPPPPPRPAATAPPLPAAPATAAATPQPLPAPSSASTAGDLGAAVDAFVNTLVAEGGGTVPLDARPAAAPPSPPPPSPALPSPPTPQGEIAPPKARGDRGGGRGGRSLSQLPPRPPLRPPPSLAAAVTATPAVGHRLLGVGVLVPTAFLPGAPSSATVRPGSRGTPPAGPGPPPPGSPGGPAPILPGRHTLVAQYGGDDVFERGVGVVQFDIDEGCGVL